MNARSYDIAEAHGPIAADSLPRSHSLTAEESRALFDQRAKELLGMSGDEFRRKWEAGEIEDPDRSEVLQVWMLLPWTE